MLEPGMSALYVVFGTMIVHGPHAVGANVPPICCGRGSERLTRTDLNNQVGTFFWFAFGVCGETGVILGSFWSVSFRLTLGSCWPRFGVVFLLIFLLVDAAYRFLSRPFLRAAKAAPTFYGP